MTDDQRELLEQARQQITRAEQFLEVAERLLDPLSPPPENQA